MRSRHFFVIRLHDDVLVCAIILFVTMIVLISMQFASVQSPKKLPLKRRVVKEDNLHLMQSYKTQ